MLTKRSAPAVNRGTRLNRDRSKNTTLRSLVNSHSPLDFWHDQPGQHFVCVTAKRGADGKWSSHKEHWGTPPRQGDGEEFYFCPHGFNAKRRKKEHAVPGLLLWADLDEADPREAEHEPTVAWETSPGRYACLWRLSHAVSYDRWERLLKGMTYAVGADRGGWDPTQLLRVPGSRNWKYPDGPRGNLLWANGPTYSPDDLPEHGAAAGEAGDPDVYRRNEKLLKPETRRLLMAKTATGDRSETLWRLMNDLLEAGVAVADTKALCQGSVWNKFVDRPEQFDREVDKILAGHLAASTPRAHGLLPHFSGDDYQQAPARDMLVKGLIGAGELSLIYGQPKCGKSFLSTALALAIAAGEQRWFDHRIKRPGPVLYVIMEGQGGYPQRLTAWSKRHGPVPKQFVCCTARLTLLTPSEDIERLEDLIEAKEADLGAPFVLIVIDTAARAMTGADENTVQDMGDFLAHLARLQDRHTRPHVQVIHHENAAGTKPRGSTSLLGAGDTFIRVERSGDGRTWTLQSAKDDADGEVHGFKLAVVDLGRDEDGDPITSCVVDPCAVAAAPERQLSKNQQIVMQALYEAIKEHGHYAPVTGGNYLAVTEQQLIDVATPKMTDIKEARYRTHTVRKIIPELVKHGKIECNSGYIWPT